MITEYFPRRSVPRRDRERQGQKGRIGIRTRELRGVVALSLLVHGLGLTRGISCGNYPKITLAFTVSPVKEYWEASCKRKCGRAIEKWSACCQSKRPNDERCIVGHRSLVHIFFRLSPSPGCAR